MLARYIKAHTLAYLKSATSIKDEEIVRMVVIMNQESPT